MLIYNSEKISEKMIRFIAVTRKPSQRECGADALDRFPRCSQAIIASEFADKSRQLLYTRQQITSTSLGIHLLHLYLKVMYHRHIIKNTIII